MSLDSTRLAAPAVTEHAQDIPSGSARDLRVLLPYEFFSDYCGLP